MSKNGLNFYKITPDFIYVINFQKSSYNTAFETRFYINCGIYAPFFDAALGKEALAKPKEYECHFRDRISSIINSKTPHYEIYEDTDVIALYEILENDLRAAFKFFDDIKTEENLIDLMLERNGLAVIEQLFEYLLIKSEKEILTRQALKLFGKYGGETRWKIFEKRINGLLVKYGYDEIKFKG